MIKRDVPLKDYSQYKIGGPAAYFLEISTKEELLAGLRKWQEVTRTLPENQRRIFVLGGGTNILFPDEGLKGLVIKNSIDGISLNGTNVTVGGGTLFSALLDFCIANSLSGLEWAGGMPGTAGGAIRGNAGAFAGETKDNISEVTSINLNSLKEKTRNREECQFSYRSSVFKTNVRDEIIVSVTFALQKGDRETIKKEIDEKVEFRKKRHPLESPNIGSIFKNVPAESIPEEYKDELSQYVKNDPFLVVSAAKIIFLTGLKGKRVGDVAVSEKHTNFIVNLGSGKAADVKKLIAIIKDAVRQRFNVALEEEIMEVN
jgi:UDP-N-acetylmuramate dehydrogenase